MSVIHLRHIRAKLESDYCPHLDLSDYDGKPEQEVAAASLSRGLAALAIADATQIEPEAAAKAVTDGFNDNGIDAIGIDTARNVVVVVQSKWDSSGSSTPDVGSIQKFAAGFRDLIAPRFERFNAKVQALAPALTDALENPEVRFEAVIIHTGVQPLSAHAETALKDLLTEINDVSEVVSLLHYNQAEVHGLVARGFAGAAPDLAVVLHDWGLTHEPFEAFYGQVEAAEIALWWEKHQATLFDRNLRKFIQDSSVNAAIEETLRTEPEKFWYFNNGVTVLCDRIRKAPVGAGSRQSGSFIFEGATVVNGAQTVGSIGRVAESHPGLVESARVSVRFISLEQCPDGFESAVTRANNTQNRIERRDFVALDQQQDRLRIELSLELEKTYAIKTGDPQPPPSEGCTVVDATIALACAESAEFAAHAKREIGRLWEDVSREPYTRLFNPRTTARRVWNAVEVMREVDRTLRLRQAQLADRERMAAIHGNRLVAFGVFQGLPEGSLESSDFDLKALEKPVSDRTNAVLASVIEIVSREYGNGYLASLFKNIGKCKDIASKLNGQDPPIQQQLGTEAQWSSS